MQSYTLHYYIPSFMDINRLEHSWGSIKALDILNLPLNESESFDEDLSLAFIGVILDENSSIRFANFNTINIQLPETCEMLYKPSIKYLFPTKEK